MQRRSKKHRKHKKAHQRVGRAGPVVEVNFATTGVFVAQGPSKADSEQSPVERARNLLICFERGLKESSIAARRNDLRHFAAWLGVDVEHAVVRLFDPDGTEQAQRWLDSLIGVEGNDTRHRRAATLRQIVKVSHYGGFSLRRLWVDVPVGPKIDMRGPTLGTVHKMLAACGGPPDGARNLAFVWTCSSLALRPLEALAVRDGDFSVEEKKLLVRGKAGRNVTIDVPDATAAALGAWIDLDRPKGAVFHSRRREAPLSVAGINEVFRQISGRISRRVLPRGLRHFAITTALGAGFHWRSIRAFARHSSATSLLSYDDRPAGQQGVGTTEADPIDIARSIEARLLAPLRPEDDVEHVPFRHEERLRPGGLQQLAPYLDNMRTQP